MDLVEATFSNDNWFNTLDKATEKTIPYRIIAKYGTPEERISLLKDVLSGSYSIKPPRVVKIPKDNGEYREIYINSDRDRILLAAVNSAYYSLYGDRLPDCCKAYREGQSCAKVVREVSKQNITGYKLDLSKYFDSVPIELILNVFYELDTGSPLEPILVDYYMDNHVYISNHQVDRYKSLAQGCALSAFLSNYVLRDVDLAMSQMCEYYCRYSDDMLLLGANAEEALVVLKQMLSERGLSLNPNKIEKIDSWHEFKFLGFGLKGSTISISEKDFIRKKHEVKSISNRIRHNSKLTTDKKLHQIIKAVNRLFYNFQDFCHGWLYSKAQAINSYERLAELDAYTKDCIRAAVTGSWNYTSNMNKLPEDTLKNNGYRSLVQMCKLAAIDRDAFQQEQLSLVGG